MVPRWSPSLQRVLRVQMPNIVLLDNTLEWYVQAGIQKIRKYVWTAMHAHMANTTSMVYAMEVELFLQMDTTAPAVINVPMVNTPATSADAMAREHGKTLLGALIASLANLDTPTKFPVTG